MTTSLIYSAALFTSAAYVYCRGDHWAFVVLSAGLGVFFLVPLLNTIMDVLLKRLYSRR